MAARGVSPGHAQNLHELAGFFHPRQPFTTVAVLAVIAAILDRRLPRTLWPFRTGAVGAPAFVLWHRPLHDNHMVALAVAAAAATGLSLGVAIQSIGRGRAVAVAGLAALFAAGYVQDTRQMQRNAQPIPAGLTWAAGRLAATTQPGSLVVSDEPLVPFLAHRRMPGRIIDTALLRFSAGYLNDRTVIRAAADPRVAAVVVGRASLSRPNLPAWVARHFVQVGERDGVSVYVRRI